MPDTQSQLSPDKIGLAQTNAKRLQGVEFRVADAKSTSIIYIIEVLLNKG